MNGLTQVNRDSYRVIGLMSGTSLDGVDLALCLFTRKNNHWNYRIEAADTIPYPEKWLSLLPSLMQADAYTFARANSDLGYYFGGLINTFTAFNDIEADFVASHGHTVFHQPDIGMTTQIGNGAAMAATCGMPVVCDFRSTDVALGGQGAPLVPVGDALLFSDYTFCLNLGGFSNVSYDEKGQRIAYDICPVNTLLNKLARKMGVEFDRDGMIARSGTVDTVLLEKLNALSYYDLKPPKSLGFEWNDEQVWPLLNAASLPVPDLLCTVVEHVAIQLSRSMSLIGKGKILVTGGGAKNVYLMERFRSFSKHEVIIPSDKIIDYKEALIFAFLGVLRVRGEANCLCSVTGASRNSVGGAIYLP
ncbi:MAG: anhydro-N-acetylmuramic acid kinase [Bacteroidota bacterium]|nr:anhydro-N-acetylmuramic acid kinase [Bacteroidota bacterium]